MKVLRTLFYKIFHQTSFKRKRLRTSILKTEEKLQELSRNIFSLKKNPHFEYADTTLEILKTTIKESESFLTGEKIPQNGQISTWNYYIAECNLRLDEMRGSFATNFLKINESLGFALPKPSIWKKYCYFCSSPMRGFFPNAHVSVEQSIEKVFGCFHCYKKLKSTSSAKILYFQLNGKKTHWQKDKEYIPTIHYWGINALNETNNSV